MVRIDWHKSAATLVLLCGGLAGAPAAHAATQTLSYQILMEGDPVGTASYQIDRRGARTEVEGTVDSKAKVVFLTFHYHHHRHEIWTGDKLESLVADTDDNGTTHHIEAMADNDGLQLVVDGVKSHLGADTTALTYWNRAILGHDPLLSVDSADPPYKVAVRDVGQEKVSTPKAVFDADHYSMTGDVDRELWYGADGDLVKVTWTQSGFAMAMVRQ
jgi:hypothetical protein